MANSPLAQQRHQERAGPRAVSSARERLDRLASFRVTYLAFFAFALLYVFSLNAAEWALERHFVDAVEESTRVSPAAGPVSLQIQRRVGSLLHDSPWIRWGRVRVNVFVLGADGRTPLYVGGGRLAPPPPMTDPEAAVREAMRLLPAISEVRVAVPPDSVLSTAILIFYASLLLTGLFLYNRGVARREMEVLNAAVNARDESAGRAGAIEAELGVLRARLAEVEPSERAHGEEIRKLQLERQSLQQKIDELAERESELRASLAVELAEESQALEELLDEAMEDLGQKEEEIQRLQDSLKRAAKAAPSSKGRAAEHLSRRLRTLYKNLEIDDRAIQDMVALRDETMKLKAEEGLKRLCEDPETAAVRRKVGGLPPQLSIFEMGFAGKGRIYYTRSEQRRFRILLIGAKNSQKPDLEYLSRLSL